MPRTDGETEYETAGRIIRAHETGRCPMCSAGGCWLIDWAADVRSADGQALTTGSTVPGMTTPPGQQPPYTPPYIPGPPVSAAPASPYPPTGAPPPKKSFWGTTGGILTIIGASTLMLLLFCGGLMMLGVAGNRSAAAKMDVKLTSCQFTGSDLLPAATVGYTVTNNGSSARSVSIKIEYRDATGARLDTDTAYVASVPAGDTVRGEETTLLNAKPVGTAECRITGVS